MTRLLKWAIFVAFCFGAWVCALASLLVTGWAPCHQTGRCFVDGIVIVAILLMLPAQVFVATRLRRRAKDA